MYLFLVFSFFKTQFILIGIYQAAELARSLKEANGQGIDTRGIVVINPGNPTGQILSVKNMEEIVEFCSSENITLMADEVYQDNVFGSTPFTSFRKVVHDRKLQNKIQMVSFHSISKGYLGEYVPFPFLYSIPYSLSIPYLFLLSDVVNEVVTLNC